MSDNPFDKYKEPSEFMLPQDDEDQSLVEINERIASSNSKVENKSFWRWMMLAAAVLFLMAVALLLKQPKASNTHMAEQHFEAFPNYITPATRGDINEGTKQEVYKAYDSGEYEKASTLFENLAQKSPEDQLYHAISLQAQGKWMAASGIFNSMSSDEQKPEYRDAYLWYSALSEIHNGESESAQSKMQILSNGGGFFAEKAIAFLK